MVFWLEDRLATRDWSMGTIVASRESIRETHRGLPKGVAMTIAPFRPKMGNNRDVLCERRFPLTVKPFWIDQRLGLIYKPWPSSTRFEITIFYII